ncbi:MAG TPA: hypothetical protein PLE63_10335 [Thermoleophilia bacterium]|nr:hypothetical protein [Acidobacteriota bacterium]HQF53317.1 hypothetical protein [Thermoleophilia bacterium]
MRTTVSNTCRRVGVAPLTVALLTALLMMALAACGSDGAPSADQGDAHPEGEPAAMIEPSQLISQDEAESIIGHTLDVVEDTQEERVGLKQRLYTATDDMNALLQIGITQQAAMPPEQTQTPEDLYRAITENFDDAVQVDGIGEEACFATPGLHILESGRYILVAVGNTSTDAARQKLKEAGRVAVENLRAALR